MQTDELRMCNGSGDKQIGKKPSRVQYKVNTRERTIEKITRSQTIQTHTYTVNIYMTIHSWLGLTNIVLKTNNTGFAL